MSRIHEALKKAEQERALSQPTPRVENSSIILEPAAEPARVIASTSVLVGAAPTLGLNYESLLARCPQTRWNPDPKTMLFFSNDEHRSGTEEFRTLRSRLYQIREKQTLSKLLVTSALPKEGKSFTSANLAQVIVRQHGRRALLIDADLRNPTLHKLLGAQPGPGLAEYLRREADEFSVIQQGPLENLFFIPAQLRPRVILRFGSDEKTLLISGMLAGGSELVNKPAVVDVPVGKGHVVMFATNPMWRHQTQGEFFLLFNAALNFDNLNAGRSEGRGGQRQTSSIDDDQ